MIYNKGLVRRLHAATAGQVCHVAAISSRIVTCSSNSPFISCSYSLGSNACSSSYCERRQAYSSGAVSGDRTTSTSNASSVSAAHCTLCDTDYKSWPDHAATATHTARAAICRTFLMPERQDSIMDHITRHIQLDLSLVDACARQKEERRRQRLSSTVLHLVEQGVVRHALPFTERRREGDDASAGGSTGMMMMEEDVWLAHDAMMRLTMLGESYMRCEAVDRVARLMPAASAQELRSIVAYVLSSRQVARLYDELDVGAAINMRGGASPTDPKGSSSEQCEPHAAAAETGSDDTDTIAPQLRRAEHKALTMFACLGELQIFHQGRDTSQSVTDKAAADRLVLHVLASHTLESVVSELVHGVLQRVVQEGTPVWRDYVAQRKKASASTATDSSAAAEAASSRIDSSSSSIARVVCVPSLQPLRQKGLGGDGGAQQGEAASGGGGEVNHAERDAQLIDFFPLIPAIQTGSNPVAAGSVETTTATVTTTSRLSVDWVSVTDKLRYEITVPVDGAPNSIYAAVRPALKARRVKGIA